MPPPNEPHLFIDDEPTSDYKVELLKEFEIERANTTFKCKFTEDRKVPNKPAYIIDVSLGNQTDQIVIHRLLTKRKWMIYYLIETIGVYMNEEI